MLLRGSSDFVEGAYNLILEEAKNRNLNIERFVTIDEKGNYKKTYKDPQILKNKKKSFLKKCRIFLYFLWILLSLFFLIISYVTFGFTSQIYLAPLYSVIQCIQIYIVIYIVSCIYFSLEKNRPPKVSDIEQRSYIEPKNEVHLKTQHYASSWTRFFNYIMDLFIVYVLSIALIVFFFYLGLLPKYVIELADKYKDFFGYIIYLPFIFIYYYIFESLFQMTPGKFITRTKVLDVSGSKASDMQILKRTLIRLIPIEPFSGFNSNQWYGWHDSWSKTMVVDNNYSVVVNELPVVDENNNTPLDIVSEDATKKTKKCPYCGEQIMYEAIKCRFCKEFIKQP